LNISVGSRQSAKTVLLRRLSAQLKELNLTNAKSDRQTPETSFEPFVAGCCVSKTHDATV